MKKGFEGIFVAVALIIGALIIGACILGGNYYREETVTITVKDKERVVDSGGGEARYLIWSEDGETFENTDTLIKGKFNSSDVYGQLERGKTYNCKVHGWRNGFFSMYRNIINCSEIKDE